MDLKDFLPTKKKLVTEYYWSVTIEPDWVQAGIWEIKDDAVETTAVSPPNSWGSEEDLVSAIDNALSSVVQKLPENAREPQKCVFGLPSSWVEKGEIKPGHLEKLKKLCADLSLEPSGFVVLPEAVSYLTKTKEGSPLTAVVLGVSSENIELSIFRLGKLIGTTNVARSVSMVDDLAEGLSRFADPEPFPSRFVLYNGKEKELDDIKQSLLGAQWDNLKNIKFLHTPKVEIVGSEEKILAVSLAGGAEIAGASKIFKEKEEVEDEKALKEKAGEEKQLPPVGVAKPEDVGFVIGKDVAEQKPIQKEEKGAPLDSGPTVPEEIEKTDKQPPLEEEKGEQKLAGIVGKIKLLPSILIGKLPFRPAQRIEEKPARRTKDMKKVAITFGAAAVVFFVLGFFAWWYFPKATVTVFLVPRDLKEDITLTVDINADTPIYSDNLLPGEVISTQVSSEETIQTTGTKTVGELARGTVKIQNGTSSIINLATGTVLVSGNDLKFTLDSSASVSAALSPSSPGTANVEVTAFDIGAEYNLAKDETFNISNYPKAQVDAVATSDFSGGSSRQISAVSEEDQQDLQNSLTSDLETKAIDDLLSKITSEDYFLSGSEDSEVLSKDYSEKVGDEASNLSLSLDLKVSGIMVSKEDLVNLANEILRNKIPSGFVLREEQLTIEFELVAEDGGVYELDASLVANLLPEVSPESLAKNIAGKYPSLAQDYLTSIPGFSRAEIRLKPRLPGRLGILPRVEENIEIEVAAEK